MPKQAGFVAVAIFLLWSFSEWSVSSIDSLVEDRGGEKNEAGFRPARVIVDASSSAPGRSKGGAVRQTKSTSGSSNDPEPRSAGTDRNRDAIDARPLPEVPDDKNQNVLSRTIGEHFRTHPSTEARIVHLRSLANNAPGEPPAAKQTRADVIDLAIGAKNGAARIATRFLSSVAGPLSVDEEWAIGKQLHQEFVNGLSIDSHESRRLQQLAESLLSFCSRTKGRPFTVTVIEDQSINAFAHLGGHIYLHKGLSNLINQEHELMFVLAHEIGHVELGHCATASLPGEVAGRTLGGLAKIPATFAQKMVGVSYSERDEHDADAWAYKTLGAVGKSDREILDFFYMLLKHEQRGFDGH